MGQENIIKINQNNLVRILKDNHKNESDTRFVFLLGAGASVQSEIPSATKLAKEWIEELKEDLKEEFESWKKENEIDEENPASKYTEIFRKRFEYNPQNGYETLQKIMENKQPSIGYTILSQILENTNHNFVITTNFDSLIEDALFLFTSKRPLVCGHESLANFVQLNSTRPTIIKAHRDILLDPYNSPDNTCELEQPLEHALKPILANSPLIIIGYGGNDKSIMNFLKNSTRKEIYWCLRDTKNIPQNIKEVLNENDKIVKIEGFDELMVSLQKNVYNFESIESLSKDDDSESLIVKNAYKKVKIYKQQLSKFMEEVKESTSEEFKENAKSILPSWWDYELKAEKEKDINKKLDIYKEALNAYPKSFELYVNWGIELYNLAKINNDKNLFNQAFEKYEKASILNPKDGYIFYDWGTALADLAKIDNDKDLFNQAFEKYEKASTLNPKNDSIFNNWGIALSYLAKIDNNKNLFNQAFEKYEKASILNPKNDSIFNNWGNALFYLAKIDNNKNLFNQVFEKYEKAFILNPKDDSIFNNWGTALSYLAKIDNDKNLFNQAVDKHEKGSILNPKNDSIFYNWGNALYDLAKIENDKNLFNQAFDKYEKASVLNDKDYSIFNNWGIALSDLAKIDNDKSLFNQAVDKLNHGIKLGGKKYNLACLYSIKGETDKALDILDKSLKNDEITKDFVLKDEDWAHLLEDENFQKIVSKYK